MQLPDTFISDVKRIFKEDGAAWLPRLPDLLEQCRAKWHLPPGEMCTTMSMNYIEFTAAPSGEPVVLKVGVPNPEMLTEMEALRWYHGDGAVRLLDADRDLGAILMQRAVPGTRLWEVGDNRSQTEIAASLMRRLAALPPASHGFPTFRRWLDRAFRLIRTEWDPDEHMPRRYIDRAEAAFYDLLRRDAVGVVLHGDLHHENILWDSRDGWLAIDPKGAIGPAPLEVGRYIQNQIPIGISLADMRAMVEERIEVFHRELGYARSDVIAGALVDFTLSHTWCFEDASVSDNWFDSLRLGAVLCDLLDAC